MRKKAINTKQGTVCYWISENPDSPKETLVFLHGLTADHTMFERQISCFEKNYNILTWDTPSHGASRPYENFSYSNAVEALYEILRENGIESAVMIGQSMGGFITQSFLLRHPEMVKAFVGIDTTPYGEDYYSKSDKWWLRQVEWMAYLYPCNAMKRAIARQVSVTREGRRNMLTMLGPYGKKELCHLMGIGYAGFLEDNRDMEIKCPVLLLLGDRDRTGKVRQYNRAWAKKTGFPLVIIKNAAHNSNVDNPAEVNREIERFVKTL